MLVCSILTAKVFRILCEGAQSRLSAACFHRRRWKNVLDLTVNQGVPLVAFIVKGIFPNGNLKMVACNFPSFTQSHCPNQKTNTLLD